MKLTAPVALAAVLALGAFGQAAIAQDADTDTDVEPVVEEPAAKGAVVTRGDLTEDRAVLDEDGKPVVDEAGNPVTETVVIGRTQTVETPSGHVHTIDKPDGERAVVTHERAERAERAERPERPEKPVKPEKPEKPGRPG